MVQWGVLIVTVEIKDVVVSKVRASEKYCHDPIALQLRSMNMLYEMCMEGKSTMIFVPTTITHSAMPGIIGVEGIRNLIDQGSQPRPTQEELSE